MFAHIRAYAIRPYSFPMMQKQLYSHIIICTVVLPSKMSSQTVNLHLPGVNGAFAIGNHGLKTGQNPPANCKMWTVSCANRHRNRDNEIVTCANPHRNRDNEIVTCANAHRNRDRTLYTLKNRSRTCDGSNAGKTKDWEQMRRYFIPLYMSLFHARYCKK